MASRLALLLLLPLLAASAAVVVDPCDILVVGDQGDSAYASQFTECLKALLTSQVGPRGC